MRLRGEVDLVTWDALADGLDVAIEAATATAETAAVVLDTAELSFCDVRGMEMLLNAGIRLRAAGRRLVLREPQPFLVRMLTIIEAEPVLTIDAGDAR